MKQETGSAHGQTETTTRKPNRRKRVDEHPKVQAWMMEFIGRTDEKMGVIMTMDQAADAFVRVAMDAIRQTEDDGTPMGTGEG